jgi:hypothetical protein
MAQNDEGDVFDTAQVAKGSNHVTSKQGTRQLMERGMEPEAWFIVARFLPSANRRQWYRGTRGLRRRRLEMPFVRCVAARQSLLGG